jgi:hypothetical protein
MGEQFAKCERLRVACHKKCPSRCRTIDVKLTCILIRRTRLSSSREGIKTCSDWEIRQPAMLYPKPCVKAKVAFSNSLEHRHSGPAARSQPSHHLLACAVTCWGAREARVDDETT